MKQRHVAHCPRRPTTYRFITKHGLHQPLPNLIGHRNTQCHAVRKRVDVYESLTLIQFEDTTDDAIISDTVDKIWSLQYLVAGPVCGSAGPLLTLPTTNAKNTTDANTSTKAAPATHAVLFRYGQRNVMENFIKHPTTVEMLEHKAPPQAQSISTICFQSSVPNELEAIFRRGAEWEGEGYELILALQYNNNSENTMDDALEFLELTQQLATSSAFGAVQAVSGGCLMMTDAHCRRSTTTETTIDFMMLVKFQTREQVNSFIQCPPVAALLQGDDRSPLHAVWSGVIAVVPLSESGTSSSQRVR